MEKKLKHLEFIQNVINRMAGNLFHLRGWAITLVAGLFALTTKDIFSSNLRYFYLAIIFIFWYQDGYFLSQERLFRDLFDDVGKKDEKDIDFSMDTTKFKKYSKNTLIYAMFSKTILIFYLPLIFASVFVLFFNK